MHPKTVFEIIVSTFTIILIFSVALFSPKKFRIYSLITASLVTVLICLFFALRPYWIDHQVSIKREQLNHYLTETYPNHKWEITQREGRSYSPYQFKVKFDNEINWTYTYAVLSEQKICQVVWTPPQGKLPDDGKHYEKERCD